MVYRVRVRNNADQSRNTQTTDAWPTYARHARESAGLSQSELARRLGTDRTTIWRWEHGRQRPDTSDIVIAFAREVGRDPQEALGKAGLIPDIPETEPEPPDEEIEAILAAPVSDVQKKRMLELLFQMRERDKQRRMEDIAFLLDREGGR